MRITLILRLLLLVLPVILSPAFGQVEVRTVKASDGTAINYLLAKPKGFEPTKYTPCIVALPPGREDETMAREAFRRYFEAEASRRGWLVAMPISPQGSKFFNARPDAIWAVSDQIRTEFRITGGKPHLAGVSNGGTDALSAAVLAPHRYASVTVLPGMLADDLKPEDLSKVAGLRFTFFVGSKDSLWLEGTNASVAKLVAAKALASVTVIPEAGHILELDPRTLFDAFIAAPIDATQRNPALETDPAKRAAVIEAKKRSIDAVLTDYHDAAAKADLQRYFNHFTSDFVFYGTDATERWPLDQFRSFCEPLFAKGKGWLYTCVSRNIFLAPAGETAWFDEVVANESYGECRGSGVLVFTDGIWRLAQYNLVIPVPNDFAEQVVKKGKEQKAQLEAAPVK